MFLEIGLPNSVRTGLLKRTQCEVLKQKIIRLHGYLWTINITQREEENKLWKHNAKFEGHNAEILLMSWTINNQENHYTMDIKGTEISSAMDY